MTFLIVVIILLLLVVFFLITFAWREAKKHGTTATEELVGICSVAFERASEKEARKAKALDFLREKGEVGNTELRKFLGVSRRSVVNYMTELEREGKVEQVGNTGRGVTYRLK